MFDVPRESAVYVDCASTGLCLHNLGRGIIIEDLLREDGPHEPYLQIFQWSGWLVAAPQKHESTRTGVVGANVLGYEQ